MHVIARLWQRIDVPSVVVYPRRRHACTECPNAGHDGPGTSCRRRRRVAAARQQAIKVRLQGHVIFGVLQHRGLVLRRSVLSTARRLLCAWLG